MKTIQNLIPDRRWRWAFYALLTFVFAYVVFNYIFIYTSYGFLNANVISVTPSVTGRIEKIYVEDNQSVKTGQPLLLIDPRPYQDNLAKAKADLLLAEYALQQQQNLVQALQRLATERKALLDDAADRLNRIQVLAKSGDIAQIQYVDQKYQVQVQKAAYEEILQKLAAEQLKVNPGTVEVAKAKLAKAQFELDQTVVKATVDGYVTNVQQITGQYVNVGQSLFALVDAASWWIVSRYPETKLHALHIGETVFVYLDAYPFKLFRGKVISIGWGINRNQSSSNAAPSSLVYYEPNTDWIQLAQRFPVNIRVQPEPEYPFRVGTTARTLVIR